MVGTEPWCSIMNSASTAFAIDTTLIGATGGLVLGGPAGGATGVLLGLFVGSAGKIYVAYHCW